MNKNIKSELDYLENALQNIKTEKDTRKGKYLLLNKQIENINIKLAHFIDKKVLYYKAIELLTLVDKNSKEYIKRGFEKIVNFALAFILASDEYKLIVNCDRRGSLQTIDFDILTPGNQEAHKPGGFVTSILSLALRVALVEITRPKIEGFLILDEPFSAVDTFGNLGRAALFLKKINNKIQRQMIVSSHHREFIDIADKAIKIGAK